MLFVLVAVAAAVAWCVAWFNGEYGSTWTKAKVERLIQSEVQSGWDREQIESWLNQHGFRPNYTTNTGEYVHIDDGRTMPMLASLDASKLSGMLVGRIEGREANVSLIFQGRISIFFFFDKNDVCVGHWIEEIVWGP